jgi:membrane protein YqaA with SNARE-associated domain
MEKVTLGLVLIIVLAGGTLLGFAMGFTMGSTAERLNQEKERLNRHEAAKLCLAKMEYAKTDYERAMIFGDCFQAYMLADQ